MQKKKSLISVAVWLMVIEVIMKLLGFIKQMVIANFYGANKEVDIYFVASDFINGISNAIIASVSIALIDIYVNYRKQEGKDKADNLISQIYEFFFGVGIFFSIIFMFGATWISNILAPSFSGENKIILAQYLRLFSGIIVLTLMSMVLNAILNSYEKYIVCKSRSLCYSVFVILACLFLSKKIGIYALILAQYITLVVYIIIEILCLRTLYQFHLVIIKQYNKIKEIGKIALPIIIGNSVIYINYLVDNAIASGLNRGSVSALAYSHTIDDCFVGVFITSIGSILFPHLLNKKVEEKSSVVEDTLTKAISYLILIILPICLIACLVGPEIVEVLFLRGKFTKDMVPITALALKGYVLRYPFIIVRDFTTQGLYTFKNRRGPMASAIIATIVNICFSYLMAKYLGIFAITLGTTISVVIGATIDAILLKKQTSKINYKECIEIFLKGLIPTGICVGIYFLIKESILRRSSYFVICVISLMVFVIYFGFFIIIKDERMMDLIRKIKRKKVNRYS